MKYAFIIPARDKEKHVRRAMRSAFKQTYADMQIVVSDQGSTDNTRKVRALYNLQFPAGTWRGKKQVHWNR